MTETVSGATTRKGKAAQAAQASQATQAGRARLRMQRIHTTPGVQDRRSGRRWAVERREVLRTVEK